MQPLHIKYREQRARFYPKPLDYRQLLPIFGVLLTPGVLEKTLCVPASSRAPVGMGTLSGQTGVLNLGEILRNAGVQLDFRVPPLASQDKSSAARVFA